VEKEIFFASFDFDEPESLISETGDSSCLHVARRLLTNASSNDFGRVSMRRLWR
jgi:hypothetical protein